MISFDILLCSDFRLSLAGDTCLYPFVLRLRLAVVVILWCSNCGQFKSLNLCPCCGYVI